MNKINTYKDLKVWQQAITISIETYKITELLPPDEQYGLSLQLKRAANSISLNIAEGYGRHTTKSYIQFLINARGSLYETETALILSNKLGFTKEHQLLIINNLVMEEIKMLNALIKKLEK